MCLGIDVGNSVVKAAYADRTGQPVSVSGPRGGHSMMATIYTDQCKEK